MNFHVLGPVSAFDGREQLKLGGPKQRLILAMLLAADGESVSTGALIDGVWGESVPATARKTLQGYVHHLRSEVGDPLLTDQSGYSLQLETEQVDERRFGIAVDEAKPLIELDPLQASEQLTEALGLWRGNPYADLDGAPVLRPEITRLSEMRTVALADRIDADLALGRHEALIGELESLTVEYPLRERFRAQHMLALYRSGRHGEALRAYARTRDQFIEEMGLEPSKELAALEDRILARDASLDIEAEDGASLAKAVRGYELREVVAADASGRLYRAYQRSVGREVAVRLIEGDVANAPEFIARFQADTAKVAQLNHPNIVYVQDTWREPGRVFQVMQWIEGDRLDAYLSAKRPGASSALKIFGQIGDALSAAHRAGVVHGDVSSRSVLLADTGDAYLTGFVIGRDPRSPADDLKGLAGLAQTLLMQPEAPADLAAVLEEARAGGYGTVDQFVRAVRRVSGSDVLELADEPRAVRTELRNPYKGLQAFQISDAPDFFGRDDLVDRMQHRLSRQRLIAVVGPSGSGKSSALKAGLAARLDSAAKPPLIAEMFPGAYPFEELEGTLRQVSVDQAPLSDQLVADERGLLRALKSILPADDTELVLVIDQFEEMFSMVASEETRTLFLDSLTAAVTDPRSRLRVVITLRADFFDRPLRYPEFGALIEEGLIPITIPDDAGLAAAIEGPAAAVGLDIEPGLTAQIVRDVSDQPGGLPLMQYALTDLFVRRTSNVLTEEAYRATGGVLGALATRAEELYAELGPEGQEAIHQAFLRLVTVDEGADDVRRRVTRAELSTLEVDRAALNEALQRFGSHRLVTFDADPTSRAPTVEVAHEALLREWDRLRGWIEEQRDDLVFRRRLDATIAEWEESAEEATYLLTGARLAQFDAWADRSHLALSSRERSFLQASRERDEQLSRRAASKRRRVMVALAVAAVVAALFGVFALLQRNDAAQEAYNAETARLGSEAAFISDSNFQMSLLMAVETYRRDPGFEGLSALQRVLVDAGPYLGVIGAGHDYRGVHWVTNDRILAATDTEVHLLTPSTGEVVTLPVELSPPTLAEAVTSLTRPPESGIRASSPSGLAAIADAGGEMLLVDVMSGSATPFAAGAASRSAAISDDGSLIAIGYHDGMLRIFDLRSGEELASVLAHPSRTRDDLQDLLVENVVLGQPQHDIEGVSWLSFHPDGSRLASASGVFLRAWNVPDLSPVGPEILHNWGTYEWWSFVTEPRFMWFDQSDPDSLVVAGNVFVTRWDVTTGDRVSLGIVPTGRNDPQQAASIGGYAQAGAGRALLLTTEGRVIAMEIDELSPGGLARPAPQGFVLDTQQSQTNGLAVDPAFTQFAVASNDGIVIGALDGGRLIARSQPVGLSVLPSLSGDGQTMAAGLVKEGIYDLTTDPPTRVPFHVYLPVAPFEGTEGFFTFLSAGLEDYVLRTSEFFADTSAYHYPSGARLETQDFSRAFVPAWSDDGRLVAYATSHTQSVVEQAATGNAIYTNARMVRVADFDSTSSLVVMTHVVPRPNSFAFTPTTGLLVDLETGEETPLPDMPGGLFAATFTPDDRLIVTVGGEGDIWVLDAATLERVRALQDADISTEVASNVPIFTSDGTWMFSAADGAARLWHFESGRQLGQPFPSQVGGRPFAVSVGDSLRLVTPVEGNALIWNLDMASWAGIACRAAGRNMTRSEWELFGPKDTAYRATCPEFPLIEVTTTPAPVGTTINPTTGSTTITETAALAAVESAFAAYNSGDLDTWALWAHGGTWNDAEAAYALAAGSRLNLEQCNYRGYGVWQMKQTDDPATGHGFDCAVTGTDRILDAAGIELEMTYNWIIGEGPGWSIASSNEDHRFVTKFMGEYRAWLEATHPDVAATVRYALDNPDTPVAESVPTALEYIDEFVAQSDVYPLTEPVPKAYYYGGPLQQPRLLYVPLHDS